MPTTLATFRSWLRLDLNDPAGSDQRFSDADLDRALERAVAEYSRAVPRVQDAILTTTVGSRDVSLATLSGLWAALEVEWPVGRYPRQLVPFELSPDRQTLTLRVAAAPAAAESVRVRWTSRHVVDGSTSTIPQEHEAVVSLGAYGLAAVAYSTPTSDNFRYQDGGQSALVDDTMIPREWRERAEAALFEFRDTLGALARNRALASGARVVWSQPRPAPRWPTTVDGTEP